MPIRYIAIHVLRTERDRYGEKTHGEIHFQMNYMNYNK